MAYARDGSFADRILHRDIDTALRGLVALGRNMGIMVGPALGGVLVGAIGPGWRVDLLSIWTLGMPSNLILIAERASAETGRLQSSPAV